MKLSEAIRLGATLRPQVRGVTRNARGSCALGAALEAIGVDGTYTDVLDHFPISRRYVACPVDYVEHVLVGVIRMLNDDHGWSRERIADWVETFEQEAA